MVILLPCKLISIFLQLMHPRLQVLNLSVFTLIATAFIVIKVCSFIFFIFTRDVWSLYLALSQRAPVGMQKQRSVLVVNGTDFLLPFSWPLHTIVWRGSMRVSLAFYRVHLILPLEEQQPHLNISIARTRPHQINS